VARGQLSTHVFHEERQDPAAPEEFERAIQHLGLRGLKLSPPIKLRSADARGLAPLRARQSLARAGGVPLGRSLPGLGVARDGRPRGLGRLREGTHPLLDGLEHRGLQRVVDPPALPAISEQTGVLERLQVEGHE
jgi:hypothetical protein